MAGTAEAKQDLEARMREYLESSEISKVLHTHLTTILSKPEEKLPSPSTLAQALARALLGEADGEEVSPFSEQAETAAASADDAEERRKMATMRGRSRRTGVSAESTATMAKNQEQSTAVKTEKNDEQKARIEKAIAGNILFGDMDAEQKEELFSLMFEKKLAVGEKVIVQGDEGDNFYVVDSGECDVIVNGNKVATCSDGDSFGELALMYFAPRAATIEVTKATVVWAMDRLTFRSMLFDNTKKKRDMYIHFLRSVPLLEPLEDYERCKLADCLDTSEYADGDAVITEGEEGDAIFLVEKGTAVATKLIGEENKIVKEYSAGDFFGELALLTDQPRAATVTAKGDLKCLTLGRKPFTRLVGQCQDILLRNKSVYDDINSKLLASGADAMTAPEPEGSSMYSDDAAGVAAHIKVVAADTPDALPEALVAWAQEQ